MSKITNLAYSMPVVLFLFSLLVRLTAVALTNFDGLYGQDSFAYYNYATDLQQALAAAQWPPAFFWPIGYPLLIVLFNFISNSQTAAAQMVNILMGAALAPLVYSLILSYQPKARLGGVVAGILMAVSAQLLLSSLSAMADVASLFWATLSMWLMLRYLRHLQLRWLVLTAVIISFATLTRWVYGLLIIPWGLAALFAWLRAGYSLQRSVATATIAVLIGLGLLGLHAAPGLSRGELAHFGDIEVYSWRISNAFANELTNHDGRFQYEYRTGHFYARPAFHPAYIFPLLTPLWLLGIWAIRRHSTALIILLIGWLLLIYLFLAGVPWQNWRFPLSFFPPLLVLVGLGVDWVWQWLNQQQQRLFIGYCIVALLGSGLWAVRDVGRFTAWANGTKETAVAAAPYLSPDATLIAFGMTATMQHYTDVRTVELFSMTENDLEELLTEETAVYLLLDPVNVQTQWLGKSPQQNFRWLQEHAHLKQLADFSPFILYQISPYLAKQEQPHPF